MYHTHSLHVYCITPQISVREWFCHSVRATYVGGVASRSRLRDARFRRANPSRVHGRVWLAKHGTGTSMLCISSAVEHIPFAVDLSRTCGDVLIDFCQKPRCDYACSNSRERPQAACCAWSARYLCVEHPASVRYMNKSFASIRKYARVGLEQLLQRANANDATERAHPCTDLQKG